MTFSNRTACWQMAVHGGLWAVAALCSACALGAEPTAGEAEAFETQIRPLLIQHCYKCHGDVGEPEGGLKLISRETILQGGESGPAAVAGKPDESLLISAVKHDGIQMPPEGEPLAAEEVDRLARWVERGLPWPADNPQALAQAKRLAEEGEIAAVQKKFWSFQPVSNPPLPEVRDNQWSQTTLDRFVLAELEAHGLAPSAAADRRKLLRRLSFDLVGLPPRPEEMEAFLADHSPDAVERVVDRLLASPHYGERWGRHWLDVARYADTKGYVFTQDGDYPWSYTYRDYVVRALNEDLPYDRFLIEQLAADKLGLGDDKRPLAALGFLTIGSRFMNNQHDIIDDRIDVITRGLLGLTVSCARCHDHKFDPIPTRDYYALYGVLASSDEPAVPPLFEEPPQTEAYAEFAQEMTKRQQALTDFLDGKFRELVEAARTRFGEYLLAAHALRDKPPTGDFMLLTDTDDLNPTMMVRYQAYLKRVAERHDPVLAVWQALAALEEKQFAEQAAATVERLVREQSPEQPLNPLVVGAFLGKPLEKLADAAKIYNELAAGAHRLWRTELEQAAAASQGAATALADANLEALRQQIYAPDAPASIASNELNWLELLPDRPSQEQRKKLAGAIDEWRSKGKAAPPRAMVLEDRPTPVDPHVFVRGNPNNRGEAVPRQFLRVLSDGPPVPFQQGSGRLELARAIAARDNPLTARVLVNRVWLAHFGSALVGTPSDFGLRSEPPTHPQLLDHLAWGLMANGWSLKWLHREIVLSATYAQTSDDRPECARIDPENTWLWRMNRRRLDFETMRDAVLSVAGRLEESLGGPPIKEFCAPGASRRTLYGYIDRLNLPGVFRTFDYPNPDATSPERSQTTVPQQALFFLNHPLVIESAGHLLARPEVAGADDAAEKFGRLVRLTFGRPPSDVELDWARQMIGSADGPAAWKHLAQGLLAANEFIFID